MSRKELIRFQKVVFGNDSLQEQLRDQTDFVLFIANTVKIGESLGFNFTIKDVKDEMLRNRRLWNEK